MAIKFQYNKTSLQSLNKQLGVRVRALPTIKNKESALRLEVKKAKSQSVLKQNELQSIYNSYQNMNALWGEYQTDLLKIDEIIYSYKKIAGVKVPDLGNISFSQQEFLQFTSPLWILEGIQILKRYLLLELEVMILKEQVRLLEYARKKTTQKVNLYEKVQIPGYEHAIRKIKRFLEDEENLSKSAMKIIKNRQQESEAVL